MAYDTLYYILVSLRKWRNSMGLGAHNVSSDKLIFCNTYVSCLNKKLRSLDNYINRDFEKFRENYEVYKLEGYLMWYFLNSQITR